jgi:lactate permease
LILLIAFWKPKDSFSLEGNSVAHEIPRRRPFGETLLAWSPYFLLVGLVLFWGQGPVRDVLNTVTRKIQWPGLHYGVLRMPPLVPEPAPYEAVFNLNWLSAAGTACMISCILSVVVLRLTPGQVADVFRTTCRQLYLSMVTIASVLGLAFLMNYCGATVTLGLAFAATGVLFPFFSALLGWLGVFLTGSDTSANALFGNLQVVTATALNLNPVLTASVNSAAGVMGKMISVQSIAVAVAATGMTAADESRLFRFTIKHSVLLMIAMGIISMLFAYVFPELVPVV